MRLLLDTHIPLWWLDDDSALPVAAKSAIENPDADIFVSAATIWEIAIKRALGRLQFPIEKISERLRKLGFLPLAISFEHAAAAGSLPRHHGDPFDRMLVAQAQLEGLTILTVDPAIHKYSVATLDC